ncbi:MAG: hypothetical protein RL220_1360, partial [Bacteroidota bacterium]
MVTRIIAINTSIFSHAEMRMDDCDSIQLVGPNNVGKSTLIYALNFLFIIDGHKMTFSGQRRGDKETIHHYFPTHNQSYIIFEISKGDPYCIMVRRDAEGELEYYRISGPYVKDHYFRKDGTQSKIRKWEEVQEEWQAQAVENYHFKSKTEVFNAVYQRGKRT